MKAGDNAIITVQFQKGDISRVHMLQRLVIKKSSCAEFRAMKERESSGFRRICKEGLSINI